MNGLVVVTAERGSDKRRWVMETEEVTDVAVAQMRMGYSIHVEPLADVSERAAKVIAERRAREVGERARKRALEHDPDR